MEISVIIPTYNRFFFLQRALSSVLLQSKTPKEIIVVDDGSTDDTKRLKNHLHVKYIYQPNRGVSSARNLGIKHASSKWIAFLDSDDTWHKEKLALHVKLHKQNPSLHVSYTDEEWIRDGKRVKIPKKYKKHGGYIFEKCLSHCIIAPSSVFMKRELFGEVGYFDESLEVCEDYDLWLRVALRYEIGLIDRALITKYAGHGDQLSFKHWGMDRFRVKSLENLLLHVKNKEQEEAIRGMVLHKLDLLIKGAKKHNNIKMQNYYTKKLNNLNNRPTPTFSINHIVN